MNIQQIASIAPSPRQLAWQKMEFYAFAHFGMNTFTGSEWGDGSAPASLFAPSDFDANQWVQCVKSAGMKGLILTCKHHDGFCLWPSQYTDYSVKNSPWKDGKGDVVQEVSQACKRHGIAFGVYLSPGDRHEATYGQGEAYNTFYKNQLRELASNYGDIFCFWFDGACGEGANGKKQVYDWEGYYSIIRQLQPNAVISVCGPDVRWCGNEAGVCRTSEWSVVPAALQDAERTAEKSQKEDDGKFSRKITSCDEDLGSRKAIDGCESLVWYPAEVDTSIRVGWFYHPEQDTELRSLEELKEIYYNSVGANACLLLNIPPDTRGRFAQPDVLRLQELGEYLGRTFSNNLAIHGTAWATDSLQGHSPRNVLSYEEHLFWQPTPGQEQAQLTLEFPQPISFSHVVLKEHLPSGQRIEAFRLLADGKEIFSGTVVGYQRICRFSPVTAQRITIDITESRFCPTLQQVCVYP